MGFYSPLSSLLHPMRGAYWISGGALQKGKKATEPSVQFDILHWRHLWCLHTCHSDFPIFLVVSLTETSAGPLTLQILWGLGSERRERIN